MIIYSYSINQNKCLCVLKVGGFMKDKNLLISNGVDVDKSLELFGDMVMYDETLNEFLNGISQKMEDMKKFKGMSDTYNYAILAHSLKSDAKYLGFTKLAELSLQHEMAGKENNVSFVYDNFDSLVDEVNRIIDVANKYLGLNSSVHIATNKDNAVINKDATVIVVDDSNIITNFIKNIFEDKYEVKVCTDGLSAIESVKGYKFEDKVCMLLDLNMPNVNGFAVLEYFRKNNLFDSIPVCIITGADSKEEIDKVFKYPIMDVLNKPFNERDIKNIMDKMLEL